MGQRADRGRSDDPAPIDLEALAQLPSDVVAISEIDGSVRWVSPSVQRTLGYDPADYCEVAGLDLFHPEDRDEVLRRWQWMLRSPGNEIRLEVRVLAADGSWRWIDAIATNHLDDPAVAGVVTNLRDISERRVAEEALAASEERFRTLVQSSAEVIAVTSSDGVVTYCSPSSTRVFGRSPEELVGTTPWEILHPDDRLAAGPALGPALVEPGAVGVAELRVLHADGRWRWTETTLRNLLDDPHVAGVVCNVRDIDDRKRAEDARRASEDRLLSVLQHSRDVVGVLDLEGRLVWVAPAVHDMLGWEPSQVVGHPVFDLVHPEDLVPALERVALTLEGDEAPDPITVRIRTADDRWVPVEVAGTILQEGPEGEMSGVILSMRDVRWRIETEERLRRSEERFRALVQESSDVVMLTDGAGVMTWVSPAVRHVLGHEPDDLVGTDGQALTHPDDLERLSELLFPVFQQPGARQTTEARYCDAEGTFRWMEITVTNLLEDERVGGVVVHARDITDRVLAEREQRRLTAIFEATDDLVVVVDVDGGLLYANRAARRFFGVVGDVDLSEVRPVDVVPAEAIDAVVEVVGAHLEAEGTWSGEIQVPRADGDWVPVLAQVLRHDDVDGATGYVSVVMHDISERKRFESELAHQATHDPLTGLPNRVLLLRRLEDALSRARRLRSHVAVLFLDLDHFKVVNDSLGHEVGDVLLVSIADRLRDALRPGDTVARFGGDEFVVLCEDLVGPGDAVAISRRVNTALAPAFAVGDSEVFVGVSIGIAFPDDNDVEAATLIRDADAAMYQAKAKGRARWEVFDNAMRASAIDRLDIENALRRAIERRELRVHYQPLISVSKGSVRGVEALLRWEHPERGLLAPGDFITVAEETGLIVPIGVWVLRAACRQLQRWSSAASAASRLSLSVNLSGRQLSSPSLVDDVAGVLDETGVDPSRLELEITESVLMDDVDASQETLTALRGLGVRLGIDDFGTGYSSMSYLRRFPVDVLKVDRSFVDGLGADPSDSAIVAAIVTLAHTLGLRAVAEGVETTEHLAELRNLDCDFAQGFLFARPMAADALEAFLADSPTW